MIEPAPYCGCSTAIPWRKALGEIPKQFGQIAVCRDRFRDLKEGSVPLDQQVSINGERIVLHVGQPPINSASLIDGP